MKSFVDLPEGIYRGNIAEPPTPTCGGFCRFTVDIVGEGEVYFSTHSVNIGAEGWRGLTKYQTFNVHLGPAREITTIRGRKHKVRQVRVMALPWGVIK